MASGYVMRNHRRKSVGWAHSSDDYAPVINRDVNAVNSDQRLKACLSQNRRREG